MIYPSNKIALINDTHQYTYTELLQYVTLFSNHIDINPGAIVLIYSEPRIGYAMALYSI